MCDVHMQLATSSGLRVTRYPYIALLSGSGSRTKMVASSEGMISATDLRQLLQPAVEEHGAQFVADRADQDERVNPSYWQSWLLQNVTATVLIVSTTTYVCHLC